MRKNHMNPLATTLLGCILVFASANNQQPKKNDQNVDTSVTPSEPSTVLMKNLESPQNEPEHQAPTGGEGGIGYKVDEPGYQQPTGEAGPQVPAGSPGFGIKGGEPETSTEQLPGYDAQHKH